MPKTTTKKRTKKSEQLPHELQAKLKQLQTALAAAEKAGMIHGSKMARIQCPGCGTLDLGVAWSKKTGWVVLCDTCCSMSPLDAIHLPDPENQKEGDRISVTVKSSSSVN